MVFVKLEVFQSVCWKCLLLRVNLLKREEAEKV